MESLQPIKEILDSLQVAGAAYRAGQYGARGRLLGLCRTLIASLETPIETIQRMGWAEPARNSDLRTAIDLNLFELMRDHESNVQKTEMPRGSTAEYLAEKVGNNVRPAMISRMMKHLAAMNVVGERALDTFYLLPFSRSLTNPVYRDGIISSHDVIGPPLSYVPRHLRITRYQYPVDPELQPFQVTHNTALSINDWCAVNPMFGRPYQNFAHQLWVESTAFVDLRLYPFFQRMTETFDPSKGDTLLVGIGHAGRFLQEFKKKFPDHPGRLILENNEEVSESPAGHENTFEVIRHNVFDPQPILGARAYYASIILRNYGERDCIRVLEQLKLSMVPGYSILLLDEVIVPARNAPWTVTTVDRVFNATNASMQRTEEQLRSIIQRAGFKLRWLYPSANGWTTMMELELDPVVMNY